MTDTKAKSVLPTVLGHARGRKPRDKKVVNKLRGPIHNWLGRRPWDLVDVKSTKALKSLDQGASHRVSEQVFLEPSETSLAQEMTDPRAIYRFKLGGYTTISFTSGEAKGHFACDPSSSGVNFPEYSSLASLFAEVKLVEFGIDICRTFTGGESKIPAILFAANQGTAVTPSAYADLADNSQTMWFMYANNYPTGSKFVMKANGLNWSQVTTPTVEPYAGCPGSIQFYGVYSGGGTVSNAIHVKVWGIYDFTIRV